MNLINTFIVVLCFALTGFSQPGTNDHTFNPTDIGFGFGDAANGTVRTTAIQPDGKIIIGGNFTSFNGTGRNSIARLNADGSLDATFNPGTGATGNVLTTSIQSDGKIIIGGNFTSFNGTGRNSIARLNADGSLDATFNPGTGADLAVWTTAIQPDGKIIIGGNFTFYNGTGRNYIARLNADGSLDATFNPGTGANSTVWTTSIQSDGKIIIGGDFIVYNGTGRTRIARLNADGSLDATFNPGTGANNTVSTISIQSDGKIIIGGIFTSYNGTGRNRIVRLNADGSLDATFNPGTGANSLVRTTSIQSDGKIIIGGDFTSYNGTGRNYIARLNEDGSLDATFNPGTGANNVVYTTSIQSDGKIIIGGDFTSYNGTGRNRIARLNADGSLDATFNPGTGANSFVHTTSIQTDGKIIIGGWFTSYNGTGRNYIARLNADGSLDATFNPGTGANSFVYTTSIQSDGKIIIGGDFTSYSGTGRNRIACLNADGSLDATFNPGTGASGTVRTTFIQTDGKIIIGGDFTSYNGTARNRIARLYADGSLDVTFNPGTGANGFISTTCIQNDGKIIIGGSFTSYNGTGRNRIARLNVDCGVISGTTIITNVACFGGTTGAINLTPTGGVGPYTFNWGGGVTTEDRTSLIAGTYSVTITDANGCTGTVNATVTQPTSAVSAVATVVSNYNGSQISCNGAADGMISSSPSGGVAPYSFLWSNGVNTAMNPGVAAGAYSVVVTDANGCPATSNTVTVTEPGALSTSTITATQISCFGANNGAVNVTPAGGTGVYSFAWTDGPLSEDRTGLSAGTFSVTISDANGCSAMLNATITEPAAIVSSMTQTACDSYTLNGQTYTTSGTYTQNLTAVNGCDSTLTLNLTVLNATSATISETACESVTVNGSIFTTSGTYTQFLTNAAGCDSTLTIEVTILEPTASTLTLSECDSLVINGETFTTSGVYTQMLTNVAGCDSVLTINLSINNSVYDTLTVEACGEYTFNGQTYTSTGVYDQTLVAANGCSLYQTLDVTIFPAVSVTAVYNGDSTFTATGADNYQWIDCITGQPIAGATSASFTATTNGDYAVIGTSNDGCSDTTACISVDNLSTNINEQLNLVLAPNPTNNAVFITFNAATAQIVVYDAQGKRLQASNIQTGEAIELGNYQTGVYLVEITTELGSTIERIVKQ